VVLVLTFANAEAVPTPTVSRPVLGLKAGSFRRCCDPHRSGLGFWHASWTDCRTNASVNSVTTSRSLKMNVAVWKILQVVVLTATVFMLTSDAKAQGLGLFRTQGQAQQHCPKDTVVWLDLKKRIYYLQGQRQYGRGRAAVFACRNEARRSGNRRSLFGWR
jgi:hypothetical protein